MKKWPKFAKLQKINQNETFKAYAFFIGLYRQAQKAIVSILFYHAYLVYMKLKRRRLHDHKTKIIQLQCIIFRLIDRFLQVCLSQKN